jgi:hypothetical protein
MENAPSTALGCALSDSFPMSVRMMFSSSGTVDLAAIDAFSISWRTSSSTMREVRKTLGFLSSTALAIMPQSAGAAFSQPGSSMRPSMSMLVLVSTASLSCQLEERKQRTR